MGRDKEQVREEIQRKDNSFNLRPRGILEEEIREKKKQYIKREELRIF